jgi:hypothetical protein
MKEGGDYPMRAAILAVLVATLAGLMAEETAAVKIDADIPGGNIVFERIDGDTAFLRQDLRDTTSDWFYWYFRVRGAEGRTLTFRFTGSTALGVRGPACSLDGGLTWTWLGAASVKDKGFTYTFAADARDVRFSFGMPYLQDALKRFLDAHRDPANLRVEELCKSRKGRAVELLRLGCLGGEPKFRVLFTCRHHCCEMMASYVLEGIMAEVLADTEAGRWLRGNVEFMVLPFTDKDGVEDGDQGKNRKPHDHNRDYNGESLFPEIAALKKRVPDWVAGKPCFGMDLHCPWIRGGEHEAIMSPSRASDAENWKRLKPFLEILEQTKSGPLAFPLAVSEKFVSWDGKVPDPKEPPRTAARWMLTVPGMQWAMTFEVPYANASGQEVNQETARTWGHDFAKALQTYLAAQ